MIQADMATYIASGGQAKDELLDNIFKEIDKKITELANNRETCLIINLDNVKSCEFCYNIITGEYDNKQISDTIKAKMEECGYTVKVDNLNPDDLDISW